MDLNFACMLCGNPYELPEPMPRTIVECCNKVMCTLCVRNSLLPSNDGFICPFDKKKIYFSGYITNAFPVKPGMVTLLKQRRTSQKEKLSVEKSGQPIMQNHIPLENTNQAKDGGIEDLKEQVNDLEDITKQRSRSCQPTPKLRGKGIKRLVGHHNLVTCFELLPSGELVSCSSDSTIRIWNVKSGKCVKAFKEFGDRIWSILLLPSGDLASGSDRALKIWNLKEGVSKHTLTGHSLVICLQLLPTGQLASGSCDKTIKIWDLKTFSCTMTLTGHKESLRELQVLPTGELVSSSYDGSIKIWDLNTGKWLKSLEDHKECVTSLLVLSSNTLVSGGYDGTIKIWDVKSGTCVKTITGPGLQDRVRSLALSQDGKMMISCVISGKIKIWDVGTWKCVMTIPERPCYTDMGPAKFLPTGELVICRGDSVIKIWR